MSNDEGIRTILVARVRALLPEDWRGSAGKKFHEGTQQLSEFAKNSRIRPQDVPEDGIELGRRKLTGLASVEDAAEKNYADAAKAFTESEDKKIDIELKRKALEIELSSKKAAAQRARGEARKAAAEASLAETEAVAARFKLLRKLEAAGKI